MLVTVQQAYAFYCECREKTWIIARNDEGTE